MRGNHAFHPSPSGLHGPIPAHAGEPVTHLAVAAYSWAYPRACGGTIPVAQSSFHFAGLSPRMRGNPKSVPSPAVVTGPIPAHAGEPDSRQQHGVTNGAYPRACGGTVNSSPTYSEIMGLSPRMRGNHEKSLLLRRTNGPIPAHAGEPAQDSLHGCSRRAYPRACGGTVPHKRNRQARQGLSPRMRGNLEFDPYKPPSHRPIPAHAGEPCAFACAPMAGRAYPRACGGTPVAHGGFKVAGGLSPRMRGNHIKAVNCWVPAGPIPAHAGEPRSEMKIFPLRSAYPRACGGTVLESLEIGPMSGLSPRMRGNPQTRRPPRW